MSQTEIKENIKKKLRSYNRLNNTAEIVKILEYTGMLFILVGIVSVILHKPNRINITILVASILISTSRLEKMIKKRMDKLRFEIEEENILLPENERYKISSILVGITVHGRTLENELRYHNETNKKD